MSVREDGRRELPCGKVVDYTLFHPLIRQPTGSVVIVHGFSRDRTSHLKTAQDIAAQGLIAFAADMVTLMWGVSSQERNIEGVVSHVRWLYERATLPGDALFGLFDPSRVALMGHSAGGAVCLQAAWRLQMNGLPPAGMLLLDAVPWPRTMAEVPANLQPLPVCSLRCEPSSWNLQNLILDLQASLFFETTDVFVIGGNHMDPERPLHSGKLRDKALYWLGVVGSKAMQDVFATVALSFLTALLIPEVGGSQHQQLISDLQVNGIIQVTSLGPRGR